MWAIIILFLKIQFSLGSIYFSEAQIPWAVKHKDMESRKMTDRPYWQELTAEHEEEMAPCLSQGQKHLSAVGSVPVNPVFSISVTTLNCLEITCEWGKKSNLDKHPPPTGLLPELSSQRSSFLCGQSLPSF